MSATFIFLPIDEKTELELWDKLHQPPSGFFSKRQSDMKNLRVVHLIPPGLITSSGPLTLYWDCTNNKAYCYVCRSRGPAHYQY